MDGPRNHQPGLTNGNGHSQPNNTVDKKPVSQVIANRILQAIKPEKALHKSDEAFVLDSSLRDILSPENIQGVLDEIQERYPKKPIIAFDTVFDNTKGTGRLKILATLIYLGKTKRLHDFVEFNVWDGDLPLTDSADIFADWSELTSDGFVKWQYLFLAPVIDFECMEHKTFHNLIRMPFLDLLNGRDKGAHGQVSKIRIPQDYQEWGERARCDDHYAVKRFGDDVAFEQEREALLRFSHPKTGHKSLIQLLYSYELRSTKYLIFPCAEGDLECHWTKYRADPTSRDDLIWMLEQCHGIASGLERVHNNPSFKIEDPGESRSRGRHGDIKPKNILFFKDNKKPPGRLVVADFTLMRFHSSNADNTLIQKVDFSETYRPPEKALGEGTQVSQKYDIWTLGCVFLEFISWHLLGSDAVRPRKKGEERGFNAPDGKLREDFGTSRQRDDDNYRDDKFFNSIGLPAAIVKKSVVNWIKYLRGHKSCSKALCQFLDLIEDGMLVVAPEDRYSMLQVTTSMADILLRARLSPERCQPLRRLSLLHTHNLPHLLEPLPPDEYWPPPQPESVPTTATQDPDYDLLEDAFLTPDPEETANAEGWLDVQPRGESSLGRASNSFMTNGSSVVRRESGDYVPSVTPATTRQPSVRDRASHESRRLVSPREEGRPGGIPDLMISEMSLDKERRSHNVGESRESPAKSRRQLLKDRIKAWKGKVKLRIYRLIRLDESVQIPAC